MRKQIRVDVRGEYITPTSRVLGAAGGYHTTELLLTFDEMWAGTVKKLYMTNARGQNPVEVILTDAKFENGSYTIPVPAEPVEFAGEVAVNVRGIVCAADGVAERVTVAAQTMMQVLYADIPSGAEGELPPPTPSELEQMQAQVDALLGDITEQATIAEEARDGAVVAQGLTESARDIAVSNADKTQQNVTSTSKDALQAKEQADRAEREAIAANGSAIVSGAGAIESEHWAGVAQAQAESVNTPSAVGVFNVILTDRATGERYAMMVLDGVLTLLGVSDSLDSVEVNLYDVNTGTGYGIIVEDGILKLEEV